MPCGPWTVKIMMIDNKFRYVLVGLQIGVGAPFAIDFYPWMHELMGHYLYFRSILAYINTRRYN